MFAVIACEPSTTSSEAVVMEPAREVAFESSCGGAELDDCVADTAKYVFTQPWRTTDKHNQTLLEIIC